MFYFSPWYVHLHKSKMAAVGHPEFLTFVKLALEPHVIPHFSTKLSKLNSSQWLFNYLES